MVHSRLGHSLRKVERAGLWIYSNMSQALADVARGARLVASATTCRWRLQAANYCRRIMSCIPNTYIHTLPNFSSFTFIHTWYLTWSSLVWIFGEVECRSDRRRTRRCTISLRTCDRNTTVTTRTTLDGCTCCSGIIFKKMTIFSFFYRPIVLSHIVSHRHRPIRNTEADRYKYMCVIPYYIHIYI